MKNILIIGGGAMGSAFTIPCIENKNDVTVVGTHLEDDLIKNIVDNLDYNNISNEQLLYSCKHYNIKMVIIFVKSNH